MLLSFLLMLRCCWGEAVSTLLAPIGREATFGSSPMVLIIGEAFPGGIHCRRDVVPALTVSGAGRASGERGGTYLICV